jgi:hypothetical protein
MISISSPHLSPCSWGTLKLKWQRQNRRNHLHEIETRRINHCDITLILKGMSGQELTALFRSRIQRKSQGSIIVSAPSMG